MPIVGPNQEDQRKIHAETNQIINQRFLLTTLAITTFGILSVWIFPKAATPAGVIGGFPFLVSLISMLLVFGLFFLNHLLRQLQITFTNYLIETKSSGWEQDFQMYRSKGYFGYTKSLTLVFLLVNFLSFSTPFFYGYIYSLSLEPIEGIISVIVVFTVTTLLIYLMGYQRLFDHEHQIAERWKSLSSK